MAFPLSIVIVAILVSLLLHSTFLFVALVGETVAVSATSVSISTLLVKRALLSIATLVGRTAAPVTLTLIVRLTVLTATPDTVAVAVIVAVPCATGVTTPLLFTVAMEVLDDTHDVAPSVPVLVGLVRVLSDAPPTVRDGGEVGHGAQLISLTVIFIVKVKVSLALELLCTLTLRIAVPVFLAVSRPTLPAVPEVATDRTLVSLLTHDTVAPEVLGVAVRSIAVLLTASNKLLLLVKDVSPHLTATLLANIAPPTVTGIVMTFPLDLPVTVIFAEPLLRPVTVKVAPVFVVVKLATVTRFVFEDWTVKVSLYADGDIVSDIDAAAFTLTLIVETTELSCLTTASFMGVRLPSAYVKNVLTVPEWPPEKPVPITVRDLSKTCERIEDEFVELSFIIWLRAPNASSSPDTQFPLT